MVLKDKLEYDSGAVESSVKTWNRRAGDERV
jgi:hypothetical protein